MKKNTKKPLLLAILMMFILSGCTQNQLKEELSTETSKPVSSNSSIEGFKGIRDDLKTDNEVVTIAKESSPEQVEGEIEGSKKGFLESENSLDKKSPVEDVKEVNNEPKNHLKPEDGKEDKDKETTKPSESKPNPKVEKDVHPAPTPELELTYIDESVAYWVKSPLNMRTGAGTGYPIVTTLPLGEKVQSLSRTSNGWMKITVGGKEGFVSGKYLSQSEIKKPEPTPKPTTPEKKTYKPMTMYFPDVVISYKNGGKSNGQSIIDKNANTLVSTWGGAEIYSGTDNKNTHFVGHNPGVFKRIPSYPIGTVITITDSKGNPATYRVTEKFVVDDYGMDVSTKVNRYNEIVSIRGGEVIHIQTCKDGGNNWILKGTEIN